MILSPMKQFERNTSHILVTMFMPPVSKVPIRIQLLLQ